MAASAVPPTSARVTVKSPMHSRQGGHKENVGKVVEQRVQLDHETYHSFLADFNGTSEMQDFSLVFFGLTVWKGKPASSGAPP